MGDTVVVGSIAPTRPFYPEHESSIISNVEYDSKHLFHDEKEYTTGEREGWTNPNGLKIPKIVFSKDCKKCHGTGAYKKRFGGGVVPCPECYSKQGYCKKCYGTRINYKKNKACSRCQGHCGGLIGGKKDKKGVRSEKHNTSSSSSEKEQKRM
jgi:hypothetical protein